MKRAIGMLSAALVMATSLLLTSCAPPKPTILVYGDSLTNQSESATHFLYDSKYNVVFLAYLGTAMCDWSPHAAADRKTWHPTRVVLAFTGNAHTCAQADFLAGGVTGAVANYQRSLVQFHQAFNGLPITVIGSPAMHPVVPGSYPVNGAPALNAMYQTMCTQLGMRYSSAADDVLTPRHVFVWRVPRFVNGPLVVVRTNDGIHLLPDGAIWYGWALLA